MISFMFPPYDLTAHLNFQHRIYANKEDKENFSEKYFQKWGKSAFKCRICERKYSLVSTNQHLRDIHRIITKAIKIEKTLTVVKYINYIIHRILLFFFL